MFDIGSQQLEIFLLPAVPTEHLDAVRQPQFLTSLHTVIIIFFVNPTVIQNIIILTHLLPM